MSIIDKVRNIRKRKVPRTLTVKSAVNLTPNMRRVTLHGDALSNFPEGSEGAYLKLLFGQGKNTKPIMRTYTVSQQRSAPNEIDVDFMLHGGNASHGIAAPWSLSTQTDEEISLFGPRPAKFINTDASYFLLAADMTALPALTANLKRLPAGATGKAFIEVLSLEDRQELPKPKQVELVWIVNDAPGSDESPLFHAIKQDVTNTTALQTETTSTWIACEFKTMRKIRQYLKVDCEIKKSHLYISSYWKKGNTEEEHKVLKQSDEHTSAGPV